MDICPHSLCTHFALFPMVEILVQSHCYTHWSVHLMTIAHADHRLQVKWNLSTNAQNKRIQVLQFSSGEYDSSPPPPPPPQKGNALFFTLDRYEDVNLTQRWSQNFVNLSLKDVVLKLQTTCRWSASSLLQNTVLVSWNVVVC